MAFVKFVIGFPESSSRASVLSLSVPSSVRATLPRSTSDWTYCQVLWNVSKPLPKPNSSLIQVLFETATVSWPAFWNTSASVRSWPVSCLWPACAPCLEGDVPVNREACEGRVQGATENTRLNLLPVAAVSTIADENADSCWMVRRLSTRAVSITTTTTLVPPIACVLCGRSGYPD